VEDDILTNTNIHIYTCVSKYNIPGLNVGISILVQTRFRFQPAGIVSSGFGFDELENSSQLAFQPIFLKTNSKSQFMDILISI
jgi:hypothetical protein